MSEDWKWKMKVSTLEKFYGENGTRKRWNEDKSEEAAKKFPFTVIVEGCYPENDFAHRWCWQQFGPMDTKECGERYSEYPGCPLVQATKYIATGTYKDRDGTIKEWHEAAYKGDDVPKHNHEGIWTSVWLGKTGYDYGFTEMYFKNEADRDKFIEFVPSFSIGENYED